MTRNFLFGFIFSKFRTSCGKTSAAGACLLAAICLHAPVALAQHGGFGGGHGGFSGGGHYGGGWHASAPSGPRGTGAKGGSLFHIFHRTAVGAPGTAVARTQITTPVTLNSSGFLLRPAPIAHPGPAPQPVFFVPVYFGSPFFFGGFNSFGWCGCRWFWGTGCSSYSALYGYGFGYGGFYGGWGGSYTGLSAGSNTYSWSNTDQFTTPAQSFVVPADRRDLVELFFQDGTVYDVTDYWVVDGQIHFLTVDETGQKTVEHVLPFDTLDVQTTTDDNTSRGFKFQLRNQSMEQYFRDHPETVPKPVDPDAPQN